MLKSRFFQVVVISCVVLGASLAAFADTIRLKDGSVIKGRVVGFREGQFVVLIGDGNRSRQMTFFSDEIDAIEFDATSSIKMPPQTSTTLPNRPNTNPNQSVRPNNDPAGNNTKIVVGKPDQNNTPPANTNSSSTTTNPNITSQTPNPSPTPIVVSNAPPSNQTSNPPANTTAARPKPIQLNLKVLADNTSNGWTNAGWVVRKGQKIRITSTGRVSLGKGNYSTPAGISSLTDGGKLMPKEPTGELIAVIGDDNNDFIPIGTTKEFIASRDGALFLGVNEGVLDDNSGAFEVTVEIDPGSGS